MERKTTAAIAVVIVLVALAALSFFGPSLPFDRLSELLYSPWFPLVLAGLYTIRPFLGWPVSLLSALVGYRYGVVSGTVLAFLGVAWTTLIPFVAARYVPERGAILGTLHTKSTDYFEVTGGLRGMVAARLMPVPSEAISIAAAFGAVSMPVFVLGTLLGQVPWVLTFVLAGDAATHLGPAIVRTHWWLLAGTVVLAAALLLGPLRGVFARD